MQIYIHRDGQQFGPYSAEQARDFLAAGNLLPGDLAWHDGAPNWVPLSEVLPSTEPAPEPIARAIVPPRRGDSPAAFASQPALRKTPVARAPVETTTPATIAAVTSAAPLPVAPPPEPTPSSGSNNPSASATWPSAASSPSSDSSSL